MGGIQVFSLVVCVVLLVFSLVFIGARLYVRCGMMRNAGVDDLFILLAGLLSIVETVFMFFEVKYGSGLMKTQLSLDMIVKQRLAVYISQPPYWVGLMFTKLSILYQYRRILPDRYGKSFYAMLFLIIATTITFLFLSAFQCTPVRGFWEVTTESKCLNLSTINYSFLAINGLTDIILLVWPMPIFMKMRLRKAEKRALIGIFALGGFAALTSVLRVPYILTMDRGGDPIYHGFGVVVWTRVEMGVSIICACLPCLRAPLAKRFPRVWGSLTGTKQYEDSPSRWSHLSFIKRKSKQPMNPSESKERLPGILPSYQGDDEDIEDCEMGILDHRFSAPETGFDIKRSGSGKEEVIGNIVVSAVNEQDLENNNPNAEKSQVLAQPRQVWSPHHERCEDWPERSLSKGSTR